MDHPRIISIPKGAANADCPSEILRKHSVARAPASPSAAAAAAPDLLDRLRRQAAAFCHHREVGSEELAVAACLFAFVGACLLVAEHLGLGASLGFISLLFASLAPVRAPWATKDSEFARVLAPLGEFLLLAGLLAGLARHQSPVVVGLALAVVVLMSWLPTVDARPGGLIRKGPIVWRRHEQMLVLLLGALIGRPAPALIAVLVMGGLDLWVRMAPAQTVDLHGPSWHQHLLLADGRLHPAARWGTFAATVIALFLLPVSGVWRF